MASGGAISHKGRITEIARGRVVVEIVSQSACSSCGASAACSMSESVKKSVEVPLPQDGTYCVGDEVDVLLSPSMGAKAVTVAYVAPLLILVILCVFLSLVGLHELYVGLAGIGGVALYYAFIYMIRGRFAKEYVFRIRKGQ